jgi:FkbM family methyltransferase
MSYPPELDNCFEKHPYSELSHIDLGMLATAVRRAVSMNKPAGTFVCFDVGTNAGSFVRAAKSLGVPTSIHCFEPHPVLAKKVVADYPDVNMNMCCVGNNTNDIVINIPMWSCGISSVIDRPVFSQLNQPIVKLQTPCITLDNYCRDKQIETIDFLKVDVEGAEKMVFDGAHELLSSKRIRCGIFEVGQTLSDAGSSTEELCSLIISYGYTLDRSLSQNDVFFYA